jgi:hypothetical protein
MIVDESTSEILANMHNLQVGECAHNCEFVMRLTSWGRRMKMVQGSVEFADGDKVYMHVWLVWNNQIVDPTYYKLGYYPVLYVSDVELTLEQLLNLSKREASGYLYLTRFCIEKRRT